MTEGDTLESTNKLLHDLERKLSFGLSTSLTHTAQSHGSVVQNAAFAGLARQNIQLSVLQYIRNNDSEFDADSVYLDRQLNLTTTFAREYSPRRDDEPHKAQHNPHNTQHKSPQQEPEQDDEGAREEARRHDDAARYDGADYDDYYDGEFDSDDFEEDHDDDMLLPPLPPRLPPREMDPDKLYGLYDFLGPDPLHCTLLRDEPVYLINDLDNYWWLIRKLSTQERHTLWQRRGSQEELVADEEDGKIGFVPAECLETYGERLARLNCFKNENLERTSRETLPLGSEPSQPAEPEPQQSVESFRAPETPVLGRSGSILKKSRGYRQSNKLVTFENLGDIRLDDDDYSDMDFTDHYYNLTHDDVKGEWDEDWERQSEVLSDVFPAETPLQVTKGRRDTTPRPKYDASKLRNDEIEPFEFHQPRAAFDNASIGSFSPDTPPAHRKEAADDETSGLRRSLVIDRLTRVTLDIQALSSDKSQDSGFGGPLDDEPESPYDIDAHFGGDDEDDEDSEEEKEKPLQVLDTTLEQEDAHANSSKGSKRNQDDHGSPELDDDNTSIGEFYKERYSYSDELDKEAITPLTSMNSLTSNPSTTDKRRVKPVQDMFLPILGKLDELTEKLAELEQML